MKIFLLIFFLTFESVYSQQSIDSIVNFTLTYRGLTKEDITIPINFDKDKSPTNDSKLLIPIVRELMKEPVKSFRFMDSVADFAKLGLSELINKLIELKYNPEVSNVTDEVLHYTEPNTFNTLQKTLLNFCKSNITYRKNLQELFTQEEFTFLLKNLMSIISESENEDNNNSDIFKFNKARDSTISVSKKTLELLDRYSLIQSLYSSTHFVSYGFSLYERLQKFNFDNSKAELINNESVQGEFLYYYDENNIRIAIGGKGKNIYTGKFDFIIDTGGDDIYNLENNDNESDLGQGNFIIDLSGNDFYSTNSNYSLAGSAFSAGFIFDKEGDDTYKGKNVSLGSAICGMGVLYDEKGNDTYQANKFSTGASAFGVGLLVDREGNDTYIANSYSQGFGMTEGVGAIVDNKGNDNYLIDARSLDIGRYEDHYVSMSQGYGLGLRPYYAGGIGLIIEGEGNDFYSTDIFGQGGAYWYALGCIVDKSGHDKYNSYQYAQGAGIHLAVGLLKDYDGWDFYSSDGVSQGCGHDFGFGLLYDVKGNDNYSAYSLSQGAGNANGIGMLIDESGRDGYLNKEPGNTRGYGNSRREYGSIGFFLDGSGDDYYSSQTDSVISNSSMWGVMNDFYLKDLPEQSSGNNFKIPLDSNKNYSQDEYFIMAKTIEPRFSRWQEYGFRKLVEDSVKTSEYILKYLDTDDHRAGLVLRNLAFRIGYTMGNLFTEKLSFYNKSMGALAIFNQNEVAFICYLFGETRNPTGKEELLNLTYDRNIRIRSAAINALGKIRVDSSDIEFINKTSQRLRELAVENSNYKLYKKDIAYAFKNYFNFDNIATLIQMMSDDYFGVRFLTSDNLKAYGDNYYNYITDNLINQISTKVIWYQSFLNSLANLSDEKFKFVFERIMVLNISNSDVIKLNYIDLLKLKSNQSKDNNFISWTNNLIANFQSTSLLKVK